MCQCSDFIWWAQIQQVVLHQINPIHIPLYVLFMKTNGPSNNTVIRLDNNGEKTQE